MHRSRRGGRGSSSGQRLAIEAGDLRHDGLAQRELHVKCGPFAQRRVKADGSTMSLDDRLADGQPQPGALDVVLAGGLTEFSKHLIPKRLGYSRPLVGYEDPQIFAANIRLHDDLAVFPRKPYRI